MRTQTQRILLKIMFTCPLQHNLLSSYTQAHPCHSKPLSCSRRRSLRAILTVYHSSIKSFIHYIQYNTIHLFNTQKRVQGSIPCRFLLCIQSFQSITVHHYTLQIWRRYNLVNGQSLGYDSRSMSFAMNRAWLMSKWLKYCPISSILQNRSAASNVSNASHNDGRISTCSIRMSSCNKVWITFASSVSPGYA